MPKTVSVVIYKFDYYVNWKEDPNGLCRLIRVDSHKFSGTPHKSKLKVVKTIDCKKFNNHYYFNTKIGVFSATTGNKIINKDILKMFK